MQSIHDFFAAWGEADKDARTRLIRASVAQPLSYVDPRAEGPVTTIDDLIAYVGMFSEAAPGAVAEVVSVSTTAGLHRATVAFRMADGSEQLGQYFVETNAEGQATRMTGFAGLGGPE